MLAFFSCFWGGPTFQGACGVIDLATAPSAAQSSAQCGRRALPGAPLTLQAPSALILDHAAL